MQVKENIKGRVTGLCAGNSPGTGEFPVQMASYAENVSIWWRHHEYVGFPFSKPSCWPILFAKISACRGSRDQDFNVELNGNFVKYFNAFNQMRTVNESVAEISNKLFTKYPICLTSWVKLLIQYSVIFFCVSGIYVSRVIDGRFLGSCYNICCPSESYISL